MPRHITGEQLVSGLEKIGYHVTRQKGSHVRMTVLRGGEHHVTIPMHNPVKLGTLSAILKDVAEHFGLTRDELLNKLFQ